MNCFKRIFTDLLKSQEILYSLNKNEKFILKEINYLIIKSKEF